MVVIDCGVGVDGGGNEYPKSEGREAFVRDGDRRDGRCVSGSTVVVEEAQLREGLISGRGQCGLTISYAHPGQGRRHTLSVAKLGSKRGVTINS